MYELHSANFFGEKTNPKAGQYVEITIADPDDPVTNKPQMMTFTFTPEAHTDMAGFIAAVKLELTATLAQLNASGKMHDMKAEFTP